MFKKLSLKFKILMIIIPLGLALLGTSAYIIRDFSNQEKQMEGLALVADSFDDFGKLIGHLQTERGKSGQYLNKKITLDELKDHRKHKTDPQIQEGGKMLTLISFIPENKKELEKTLGEIDVIRKKVDNNGVTALEMIAAYSEIIQQLLVGEGQAAALYSGKGIESKLGSITLVESLKEAIGLSRVSFTSIFAADLPLSFQNIAKAEYTEAAIDVIASSSALKLMPTLHEKTRSILASAEWKNIEKDLDKVMERGAKGGYEVDSKDFFSRMTSVIDKFSAVLTIERQAILNLAENETSKAHRIFNLVVMGLIIAISGLIIFAYAVMRDLVQREAEELITSIASGRSFSMVENSPTCTMMCDPHGTLIYMNKSAIENFKRLQVWLPEKVDNLLGKNIDFFHKNPEVQRRIISDPKKLPYKAICTCGPEKLELLITGSVDSDGKYLGTAVSWSIVTARVGLINDLTKSAGDLAGAASNVFTISSNLSAAAEETSAQANTASVASEEVNAGVQTVASNMEEMVAAIKEITKTTNEAASMTNEAMRLAKNTNKIINQLGESSMDIGNVIKVISSIAQQTNLLALNATIEAARAGEAGKGFAVVANEVKELAKQTAIATSEITKKIETIQSDSKSAIDAIAEITVAIEKVNGYTGNIAASVEEQAATTHEVTRIVTESAEGVKQINENISQVSQAASNTGKDAENAQRAAKGVGDIAELLTSYVQRLQVEV